MSLGPWERFCRSKLFDALEHVSVGTLLWRDGGDTRVFGGQAPGPAVRVDVHRPRVYGDLLLGGTIGASESFARGDWSVDDLTGLIRLAARNPHLHRDLDGTGSFLRKPLEKWIHRLRRNGRRGSRKNIALHYDLGNEFFEQFLDPTMMYSCAVFGDGADSLEAASERKNDLICRKLGLRPGLRVLEIGTGWGGFAIHAAGRYGANVVTTTISRRQYDYAVERVRKEGLGDRIEVLDVDYRELPQLGRDPFDRLVSIEMIEAVGHRWLPRFFETCSKLLAPDGQMLLQGILMRDAEYDQYRKSSDFIRRYIFPGGHLPSMSAITRSLARRTRLQLTHLQDLTPDYARTLSCWRERFRRNLEKIRSLGYPEEFLRMWEFYLCYCEGGFAERSIHSAQLLLSHPLDRRPPLPTAV